jgi:hypothetical protein
MHSLDDVHKMNAYRVDHVCLVYLSICLKVHVIKVKNHWMDLVEIWHGHYAIGVCLKVILFNFLQLVISTWQMNEFVRWDQH